jgi:osmotically-inducible protein OsmY
MRRLHLAVLACVLALGARGQSGPQSESSATSEQPAVSDSDIPIEDQPTNNPEHDAELVRKIRAALRKDKTISRYCFDITITPYIGKVKLTGAVPTQEIRHQIEQRTRTASGEKVKDEIEVQPRNWRAAR